jgi:hypothetical protein
MLSAVEETARWTTAKIAAIRALAEHTFIHPKLMQLLIRDSNEFKHYAV